MRSYALTALFVLCFTLSAATDWTLFMTHSGPIRIGMPLAEVRRALNDPRAKLESPEDDVWSCSYLTSASLPEGMGLMFSHNKVARIDISKSGIHTAAGAGVGDTEDRLHQLYKNLKVSPHPYDNENGHYLEWDAGGADRGLGLLFETDHGKVTEFRTGTIEAISLIEGCS